MGRRLRRRSVWRRLGIVLVLLVSVVVVLIAVANPRSRGNAGFRTAPVLRAMGVPDEAARPAATAWAEVPSLSVSPRFVIPIVREESKRRLMPVPLLQPEPAPAVAALPSPLALPAVDVPAPAPGQAPSVVAMIVPPSRPVTLAPSRPVDQPRPTAGGLATAVGLTPTLPRREPPRQQAGAMLALVIDDLGPAAGLTHRAINLPVPITMSFLPYATDLDGLTAMAQRRGHEIFLHLPMQPIGTPNPGKNAILVDLPADEQQRRISWAFDQVPRATGLNNHMGSRATSDPGTMLKVLQEARRRGMSFVDSRTSPLSVGDALAAQLGVPHAARDVFLDNDPTPSAILRQLAEAERDARHRGKALAIGHPYPTTLAVLEAWLPAAQARGLRIVPAGELIAHSRCGQPEAVTVSACSGSECPVVAPPAC